MAFHFHVKTATNGRHHQATFTPRGVGHSYSQTCVYKATSYIAVPLLPTRNPATIEAVMHYTNVTTHMVVDTGAALSIADSANVPQNRRVQVARTDVVGIGSSHVSFSEATSEFFMVGGGLFQHNFAVVDNFVTDYILGNDFLTKHCVVVDYYQKEVRIHYRDRQD